MYDFTGWELSDLFRVRDAIAILDSFELADKDLKYAINSEIRERELK